VVVEFFESLDVMVVGWSGSRSILSRTMTSSCRHADVTNPTLQQLYCDIWSPSLQACAYMLSHRHRLVVHVTNQPYSQCMKVLCAKVFVVSIWYACARSYFESQNTIHPAFLKERTNSQVHAAYQSTINFDLVRQVLVSTTQRTCTVVCARAL
jgi:hypothetical protein